MERHTQHLCLDLLLEDGHLSGVLVARDDPAGRRSFDGWLGLVAAIDAGLARSAPPSPSPTRSALMTTHLSTSSDVAAALRERVEHVTSPGDAGFEAARAAWVANAPQNPLAVAHPQDAAEVAATIAVARRHGLRLAVQGTGHGAGSLGDLSDAILLRTTRMRGVRIDPDARSARAEAGVEWEEVTAPAGAHGLVALHGSSPNVGVAGYSLGGGIGWLARSKGLACNSVTAIELVTMDGEMIRATADDEPELFWAMRGGGGFFGVVTAVEFDLFPLETVYAGWLIFPWTRSEEVLLAWSEWIRDVPEELTSVGRILQVPDVPFAPEPLRGKAIAVVELAFAGDEEEGRRLVQPLRALGPMMDTVGTMPAPDMVRLHQDPEDPMPAVSGHAMMSEMGPDAVAALVELVGPGSGSPLISTEVRHLGGAAGRPAPGGGALSHFGDDFALFALGVPMEPSHEALLSTVADDVAARMSRFGSGARYRNFSESRGDGRAFHSAETLARLDAVRRRVDPERRLRANHDLMHG